MTLAFFPGCKIPYFCSHYGTSTKAVLKSLGVDFAEPEFNCCGYPMRNFDLKAFVLQSARNFAIAEERGMDIVTPCKCCFGSMSHARHILDENHGLRAEINQMLDAENRKYTGVSRIRHLLSVLAEDVGAAQIGAHVRKPYYGMKVAAHYGCHALRPSSVVQFDNPFSPTIFESLIRVTGAECVDWERRLECCGQPLAEGSPEISRRLAERKITSAVDSGADLICSACTYCQLQFAAMPETEILNILYPQLLGLSMGLSARRLGLDRTPVIREKLERFTAA